jgi:hypothetical protein
MPFLTFRFFFAILPLLILGYIFGTLIIANLQGWPVNPFVIGLNALGIVVGIAEFRDRWA